MIVWRMGFLSGRMLVLVCFLLTSRRAHPFFVHPNRPRAAGRTRGSGLGDGLLDDRDATNGGPSGGRGQAKESADAAEVVATLKFDGGRAGSEADDDAAWDEETMSGPLGKFADEIFMERFRTALAASNLKLPSDYPPGYDGMISIVREIMETAPSPQAVVAKSRNTLNSLFPDWPPTFGLAGDRVGLLFWFEVLFARPFPAFSSKLNAWVTWWAAQWLMGQCELLDLEPTSDRGSGSDDDDTTTTTTPRVGDGGKQLVLVKRCRYLEAGSCASLCVNSCKLPTQQFFNEDMGVPMRMIPDFLTFECRFEFGVAPTLRDEDEARSVSCFSQCTSKKKRPDGERMTVTCGTR